MQIILFCGETIRQKQDPKSFVIPKKKKILQKLRNLKIELLLSFCGNNFI